MTPYEALENSFRDISYLLHVSAVLYWDEATMMPLGGGSARANAMAALAGILHERRTAPEIGDLLDQARSSADDLGVWERRICTRWKGPGRRTRPCLMNW